MDIIVARTIELLGVAMVVAILARRLRLPYTVGLVLTGLALALARVGGDVTLTHEVIFDVILPPLLFEAALSIRWGALRRELPLVLALATLGVALCALVVALGAATLLGWPLAPSLAFGALIAATDPIAVIALLRETRVAGRLRLVIESESLLNDGVAALLFTLVVASTAASAHAPTALGVLRETLLIGGGGVALGLVVGGVAILVAGRTSDHLVETALTAVAAYGSLLAAERLGASGLLATVSAGLLMGNLGVLADDADPFALSSQGRAFVAEFWEFAAFVANSLVFLLIGLALARTPTRAFGALAVAVALALVGRAATVYPVALLFARSRWAASWAELHFLWWGGLRGALALALALALPPSMPYRDDILVAAFGVVAFSILVQGLTAKFALSVLGLRKKG
ncbi:MAG TPA: cation:proton antiporter [Roseiarcus sp.]|jgi:CPA1 family monovalent cation:H+ antiporter